MEQLITSLSDIDLNQERQYSKDVIKQSKSFKMDYLQNIVNSIIDWEISKYDLAEQIGKLGDLASVNWLVDVSKNTNDKYLMDFCLLGAVKGNHKEIITRCVVNGADISANDVIYELCRHGDNDLIQKALQLGCDNNSMILFSAGAFGNDLVVEHFISSGEIDILQGFYGACYTGNMKIIDYYINSGYITSFKTQYKALSYALANRNYNVVRLLVDNGLDLNPILDKTLCSFNYMDYYQRLEIFLQDYQDYPI